MKRTIVVLSLLTSAAAASIVAIPENTFAQQNTTPPPTTAPAPNDQSTFAGDMVKLFRGFANDAAGKAGDAAGGVLGGFFGALVVWGRDLAAFFLVVVLQTSLFAVALVGTVLDAFLWMSLNMSRFIGQGTPVGGVIAYGWTVFRDLGNLLLIAGLIWASISMILGIHAAGQNPGRLVTNIIIVAVLVNFSYFFTGVLIDASNIVSNGIYNSGLQGVATNSIGQGADVSALVGSAVTNPFGSDRRNEAAGAATATQVEKWIEDLSLKKIGIDIDKPFAGIFIYQTRLVSIVDPKFLTQNVEHNATFFIFVVAATLFLGMTVVVFTQVAFMLIARFVILILLLMTSPVFIFHFTGMGGKLKEWGEYWWNGLVSQLVFLPVFLLLAMLSFNTLGAFTQTGYAFFGGTSSAAGGFGALFSSGESVGTGIATVLYFLLAFGLLWASLRAAKSIATQTAFELPKIGTAQTLAAQAGESVGKFIRDYVAQGPNKLRRGVGDLMVRAGQKAFEGTAVEDFAKGVGLTARKVRAGVPFSFRKERVVDVERDERLKEEAVHDVDEARKGVSYWKDQLKKAGDDPQKRRLAEQGLADAKTKFKGSINELYEVKGAKGVADYIRRNNLTATEVDTILSTLGEEKAQEVNDQLRRMGWRAGQGTASSGAAGGQGAGRGGESTSLSADRKDAIAAGVREGTQEMLDEFKTVAYLERQNLLTEKKELWLVPNALNNVVAAIGALEMGRHAADLPDMDLRNTTLLTNIATHLTAETYPAIRKRLESTGDGPALLTLHTEMTNAGKGDIIDQYNQQPRGRFKKS